MERPYNRISANNFDPLSEVEVAVTLIRVLDSGVRSSLVVQTRTDCRGCYIMWEGMGNQINHMIIPFEVREWKLSNRVRTCHPQ